jgi:BirA family biotin operon repressor/biotin-[acetyl-CoA-carboxylase] ligase
MQIIHLDETPSTNNYATARLRTEALAEWTIILTFRQTHGRGQATNTWESEDFRNLTFSLILRPEFLSAGSQFLISQAISLGINDFINKESVQSCIKWPNDILIGNRKVAGILIENAVMGNTIDWTVAGIGLNLNQHQFKPYSPEAVSLSMVTGRDYPLQDTLLKLLASLRARYETLKNGDTELIRHDYLETLYRYKEWCMFRSDEATFEGMITGTDEYGRLLVADRSGNETAWPFKSIRMSDF